MGGCDGSDAKAIDGSVGGLVWVRRRNGSWWPGRIMDLEELSESLLVSPRSGTPVKLLGREDASIDWYNLEKSRRVKAFRCGEYDECIEKAKASAASASKKLVKYARRDDAILQALELESARQGKDQWVFSCGMDASVSEHGISTGKSLPTADSSEEDLTDGMSGSEVRSDSAPELSQSGLSFEENTSSSMVRSGTSQRRTPNDYEDDGSEEGVMRMRGLEDIGIGVISRSKVQTGAIINPVQEESEVLGDLATGNCLNNEHPPNHTKVNSSLLKRKRSQVSNAHEFLKRKNRHRPLTKVLESSTMVSVPIFCNDLPNSCGSSLVGSSDGRFSGRESNESKKSISTVINNNSDSTGVSCENTTPLNDLEASHFNVKMKDNKVSSISGLVENDTSDRLFDVPFVEGDKCPAGFSQTFIPCSSVRSGVGALGRQSGQSSQAEPLSVSNEVYNESGSTSSPAADADDKVSITIEKGSSKWQLKGKRNSRKTSKTKKDELRKYSLMSDESNTLLAGTEQLDGFTVCLDRKAASGFRRFSSSRSNFLVKPEKFAEDQSIESNWNKRISQGEVHTIRGKMSKAKPLPEDTVVQQRLLPCRQSRFMVNSKYQMSEFAPKNYGSNASLFDVELEVKASYKPQHVPLVSLMSKVNNKAIVGHPLTVEVLNDGRCDDLLCEFDPHRLESSCSAKPTSAKRTPGKPRTFQPHFSRKRPSKTKKSGHLSKKIRKLSSLTGTPVVEKPKGPVIACIPLKVAFTRISEAVSGLARPTHRPVLSGDQ